MTGWQRKRKGLPGMSGHLMAILRDLRTAKQADYPFVYLPALHYKTRNSLVGNDWVIESKGLDGIRYAITRAGLDALEVYEKPGYRTDGICPRCGICPRALYKNRLKPYCEECGRAIGREQYREKKYRYRARTICPQCHIRPRHIFPSGFVSSNCQPCRRILAAEERRRKHQRRLELIRQGNPPLCIRCKAAPIYHTENTTYDYCYEHYREQQLKSARKRYFRAVLGQ